MRFIGNFDFTLYVFYLKEAFGNIPFIYKNSEGNKLMKGLLISLIILGAYSLTTACAPAAAPIPQGAKGASEDQVDDSKQLSSEGIGPLEITPDKSNGNGDELYTGDPSAGNINSSRRQSASTPKGEQPGFSNSAAAVDNKVTPDVNWLIYLDPTYKFSLEYPENYVILAENEPLDLSDPNLKYRVRFQDIDLAEGDTAEYEIPKFTIEVFDLGSQSLESYLDSKANGSEHEAVRIGDLTGIKISFKTLRAPNMHYYFQEMGNTYMLTPLGEYGDEMLTSFQILP